MVPKKTTHHDNYKFEQLPTKSDNSDVRVLVYSWVEFSVTRFFFLLPSIDVNARQR